MRTSTSALLAASRRPPAARQSWPGSRLPPRRRTSRRPRRRPGTDHVGFFKALRATAAASPRRQERPASRPGFGAAAPAQWYAPPAKVFDNLYFLGQTEYTAWAVMTSDGIIVIDPLFDYSVEEEVVKGLTKLGLDPKAGANMS